MKLRTMIIIPLLLAVSVGLGGAGGDGCSGPSAEDQARVTAALPYGCNISDLGSYGMVSHVIVVHCDGRSVTTTSYMQRVGKVNYARTVAYIE